MEFAPLAYVWGTLTVWHVAVWLAFAILQGVVLPLRYGGSVNWFSLPFFLIMLAIFYGIFALMFGQLFGDKYSWSQLWPSGVLLGGSFGALVFARTRSSIRPPVAFALLGVVLAAAFYTFCLWLLPRIVGFGLIDWPKFSWGVQL